MNFDNLTRREFIKVTGLATAGIVLGQGCATIGFETRGDIANIKWDANPAIPVPKDGCYVGWHNDLAPIFLGRYQHLIKNVGQTRVDNFLGRYEQHYDKKPAVMSFFDRHIDSEWFPKKICDALDSHGVIPLIRYYFASNFESVAKGEYDKVLKTFAQGAKEFGKPFFFVPYPEVNIGGRYKNVHPWAGGSGKQFKKAYTHIHHILKEEGANNAVFGLHLIGMGAGQPFSRFAVDPDIIDWVGFSIYNLENESRQYRSFGNLMHEAYYFTKSNYQTKPIALWEFGTSNISRQGRWIKNAYENIKKLPRIKLVVYAEYPIFGGGQDSSIISDKARPYFKEAISDPYFIGVK